MKINVNTSNSISNTNLFLINKKINVLKWNKKNVNNMKLNSAINSNNGINNVEFILILFNPKIILSSFNSSNICFLSF